MLSKIKPFLARKKETIQQQGVLGAMKQFYDEHIYIISDNLLLRRNLSDLVETKLIKRMADRAAHEVKIVTNMDQLAPLTQSYPEKKQAFEQNIKDRTVGIVICEGDTILAYNWIAFENFYDRFDSKHEYELDADEVYQFDLFVDPQSRGALVTPQILSALYNYCLSQGKKRIMTVVAADNHPSLKLHLKLNFDEDQEYLKIYNLFFWRWSKLMTHDKSYRSQFANA